MFRTKCAVNDRHFSLSHTCTDKLYSQNFHAHSTFEIFYFEGGEIQYYIEEESYSLVPGDVLLIPPGIMHRPVMIREDAVYDRYVLNLSVEYVRRLLEKEKGHFLLRESKSVCFHLGEEKENILFYFRKLMESQKDCFVRRDALTTLILLYLQERRQLEVGVTEGGYHRMQEVIRYINAHFTEKISLEQIAERFFISKYHLLRQFKDYTHSTVHQYILSKRISLAKALLREGVTPQSVALSCGFASYTGFYQAFCKEAGCNPAAFQKENAQL